MLFLLQRIILRSYNMKRKWFLGLIIFIALCTIGCKLDKDEEKEETKSAKLPKKYWGEWIGTREGNTNGSLFYLGSNGIIKPTSYNNDPNLSYNIEEISSRVIKATFYRSYIGGIGNEQWSMYLFSKRTPSSSFTGNIVGLSGNPSKSIINSSRSINNLGGIQIVITNLNNQAEEQTTTTDNDGNFSTKDTVPGDPYQIGVDGQTIDVTAPDNGGNIGTITVTNGLNLKASINERYTYLNTQFNAEIQIKNVGNQTGNALTYQLTLDDGLILNSGSLSGIIGSIAPNGTAKITLSLLCNSINGGKSFKNIFLQINDPISNKTWTDSVPILIYKDNFTLGVISEKSVLVAIIAPNNETYLFGTVRYLNYSHISGNVKLPVMNGDYIIAVYPNVSSNDPQTRYKIYFDGDNVRTNDRGFSSEASIFIDAGNYEPNNTEYTSQLITENIMSYLHTGDCDYFKFSAVEMYAQ